MPGDYNDDAIYEYCRIKGNDCEDGGPGGKVHLQVNPVRKKADQIKLVF